MPQINDWVREALRYIEKGIAFLESGDDGLSQRLHFRKILERIDLYLQHHRETLEFYSIPNQNLFWNVKIEAERLVEYKFSYERILISLRSQRDNLYEYLGESPPVNNPNQLAINFDGENQNRNTQ